MLQRAVVPETLFVMGTLPPPEQGHVPRGKTPAAELSTQLSSEVGAVTEIPSLSNDSFSVRLRVEAE